MASIYGLLIMPARQRQRRRRLRRIDQGEVEVGVGVVLIKLQSFAQGGFRLGTQSFGGQNAAEVKLRGGVGGIEGGGPAQGIERVVQLFLAITQYAEQIKGAGIVGVEGEGAAHRLFAIVQTAGGKLGRAQFGQHIDVVFRSEEHTSEL